MSMKASELTSKDLMIGDWLQDSFGNIGQVYRLDPGRVHLRLLQERPQDEEYIVHDIEPIPLTPELLENNGFGLRENATSCWTLETDSKCTIIITACEKITIYKPCLYGYRRVVDEIEMRYLHELQHLLKMCHIKFDWKV